MPRRRRYVSRLQLVYAVIIVALMVGVSLALDRTGTLVTAQVTAKGERIVVGYEPMGGWDRYYELTTAFERPERGRSEAVVRVPAARYDAARTGDSILVRYLPQMPLLARTSDRSTASVLRELGLRIVAIPIVALLVVGGSAMWIAARVGTIAVLAVTLGWAAAAWSLFFTPASREGQRPVTAMAEVQNVTLVDRAPSRLTHSYAWAPKFDIRLARPYQVVELKVAPPGWDTVLAVDAVDSGSVQGLAAGTRQMVRLDPAQPREAQLAAGTRRFVLQNRFHFLGPVMGCVLVGMLGGLGYRWRRGVHAIAALSLTAPATAMANATQPAAADSIRVGCSGGGEESAAATCSSAGREGARRNSRAITSKDGGRS